VTPRKSALVSGGSRGIGRAVVLRLAQDGFDVSFCYRDAQEPARQVVKEAAEVGARVLPVQVDVRDAEQVRAWVAGAEAELGAVDVVVTAAGITRDGPLVMMTDSDWHEVLHTNLDGVFHLCRSAAFGMMKRRAGCVIALSSVSGLYGNPGQVNYSASKAGIVGFIRALAKEAGRYGVRANVVAPGLIDTDMTAQLGEQGRRRLVEAVALRRLGRAEEVAELVGFLASDRAAYITGSVIEIHGGMAI
jgi:3-oxoacyl-[acyl-carrier protein] reductase